MKGALLVAGTSSDAGKSMIAAGLCRWLARQGVRVAPFKAQNMSLNSFVTAGGAEIGRAQAMQAAAAGIEPHATMNPVLLKPGSDRRSQVVLLGHPVAEVDAMEYRGQGPRCCEVALDALAQLRRATTWSSVRARAARRRSTSAGPTSRTWAWPGRRTCR